MVGVWDNVTSAHRMAEFATFRAKHHRPFRHPGRAGLGLGPADLRRAAFVAGLPTRWAGLVMAFNFVVAVILVHLHQDLREQFPALVLIAVSLVLATHGPGR